MGTATAFPLPTQPRRLETLSPEALRRADDTAKAAMRVVGRVRRMADNNSTALTLDLASIIAEAARALCDYDRGFQPNEFAAMKLLNWLEAHQ